MEQIAEVSEILSRLASSEAAPEHAGGPDGYAPRYLVYPDTIKRSIRSVLDRYKAACLGDFSLLVRQDRVSPADGQAVAAWAGKLAEYIRALKEPDWEDLSLIRTINGSDKSLSGSVTTIDTLPDGKFVTAAEGNIVIWSGGEPVWKDDTSVFSPDVCISPDGDTIFYVPHKGKPPAIYRIDARTFGVDLVETMEKSTRLNIAPNGDLVTTERLDKDHVRIRVFDPEHPADGTRSVADVGGWAGRPVMLRNGQMLTSTIDTAKINHIIRLDPRTGKQTGEIRKGCRYRSIEELPDSGIVIDGQSHIDDVIEKKVTLEWYDATNGNQRNTVDIASNVPSEYVSPARYFDVSPKGRIVTCEPSGKGWALKAWDMKSGNSVGNVAVPDIPGHVRVTNDGKVIVASADFPDIFIFG